MREKFNQGKPDKNIDIIYSVITNINGTKKTVGKIKDV